MNTLRSAILVAALGSLWGCPQPAAEVTPPEPTLRRLTAEQYANVVTDLFGEAIVPPAQLEPDTAIDGFFSIGAGLGSVSSRGVEQYGAAAFDLAEQVIAEPAMRDAVTPCTPSGAQDADCAREALDRLTLRAWRRPATDEELQRLTDLTVAAAGSLGDFHEGLLYGIAAVLQSPHFLYRAELGEPDPDNPGAHRYTDWEMAARLSFLLWNTGPDEQLIAAAAAGELTTEEGLLAQAERLMADPRSSEGVRALFTELYLLHELDEITRDARRYVHWSDEVGPSAREETLRLVEHLVFTEDGDFRDFLTTRTTFLNRKLASIYEVPAPVREGYGMYEFPEDSVRRGYLGSLSFLGLNAHPVNSSATLRGVFVRERLLCQTIPDPPSGVDTSIPEPSADAVTLRERVAQHLLDPACSGCHELMDPIGLGFEHFDALGRYRDVDGNLSLDEEAGEYVDNGLGAPIDSSGDLDGEAFEDHLGLKDLIRDHEDYVPCLVRNVFRYAAGHHVALGERDALADLTAAFERDGHRVQALLLDLVASPLFRQAGAVHPDSPRLLDPEGSR